MKRWGRHVLGERDSISDSILKARLFKAVERINSISLNNAERDAMLSKLLLLPGSIEGSRGFLDCLKNGLVIGLRRNGSELERLIHLVDFDHVDNNDFLAVEEFEIEENGTRRRFDLCLFVNGIPFVVIETKNPFTEEEKGTTWYDGYTQILEYEEVVPSIFKYIQFCIVSDGYTTKHFPNYYAKDYSQLITKDKGVWKSFYPLAEASVKPIKIFPFLDSSIYGMLSKGNLLDLIENFVFVKRHRDTYSKIMTRYMQFEDANLILKRVVKERNKKLGLIWDWQGSGKTLAMAFAAWKLLRNKKVGNPTILIIVDRRDMQKQIVGEEFAPIGVEIETITNTNELVRILQWGGKEREGKRGIFICLIQKFNPTKLKKLHDAGKINLQRENIVILTDESHRSQYGVLANVLRGIFKNAFIFGFTGTPLTKVERNTFQKFSPRGELYLHRYGMLRSIEDGYTIPIRYEARLSELHLKAREIEELADYEDDVLGELTPEEVKLWRRRSAPKLAVMKSPQRIRNVCNDIARYFRDKVEDTPFKAMIAAVDRESCVQFKQELDRHPETQGSEIVMTYQVREKSRLIEQYKRELTKNRGHSELDKINEDIVDRFRTERYPRILIVSDMLLTGFDAPNLWVLFLYKPLKEHRLLQAIARTNRPYKGIKEFGLIVDYVGVAKPLEKAIQQFESEFVNEAKLIMRDLSNSDKEFEKLVDELKGMLEGLNLRDIPDIDEAIEILVKEGKEQEFADKATQLRTLYELLSPRDVTFKHLDFYKWIICISIALNRYRRIGMRLSEIDQMSKKTYELIQKSVGVGRIEKVGEIDVEKELSRLKPGAKPIAAIRIIGGIGRSTAGHSSEFYVSLTLEIERIINEIREGKVVTGDVIKRINQLHARLLRRDAEREKLGELFPVFDALRDHYSDTPKVRAISKEIIGKLRKKELLTNAGFLKGTLKKEMKRTIRESLIDNLGLHKDTDEIEDKIFANLEEQYA